MSQNFSDPNKQMRGEWKWSSNRGKSRWFVQERNLEIKE